MSLSKVSEEIKHKELTTIRFEHADLHGISRSKLIPARHFEEKATGIFFGMSNLGSDIHSTPVQGTGYNEEIGFCDAMMIPDFETFQVLPWLEKTGRVLIEPTLDGEYVAAHPRVLARRQLDKLKGLGYSLLSAHEHEFHVVDKKTHQPPIKDDSLRFTVGMSPFKDFVQQIMVDLPKVGVDVECVETEGGPSEIEITYKPAFGIRAADNAHTYKTSIKEIAFLHDFVASFMSKPYPEYCGASCHFCHSLWDSAGQVPLLYDGESPSGLSEIGQHWIAGILAHAPAIQILMAPTVNCLKLFNPASRWPINATWGKDNRTTLLRVKINGENGTYFENRVGSAGCNPYLCLAANVAAGIDGVINKYKLPPHVIGSAFDASNVPPNTASLTNNMEDALKALVGDKVIREALGEEFIKCFTAVKMHEAKMEREAMNKRHTNWDFDYHFDFL